MVSKRKPATVIHVLQWTVSRESSVFKLRPPLSLSAYRDCGCFPLEHDEMQPGDRHLFLSPSLIATLIDERRFRGRGQVAGELHGTLRYRRP